MVFRLEDYGSAEGLWLSCWIMCLEDESKWLMHIWKMVSGMESDCRSC